MIITSKDNEIVKHIRKLKDKKFRDESQEFIIEGIRIIEEAINENAKIKMVVVCDGCLNSDPIRKDLLYKLAKEKVVYVSENIFKSLTDVTNPQGILAVIQKNNSNNIDFSQDLFLILDNIQDPGNMGTILRTADSVNLNQVIVQKGNADCYNPKVVRSTMGAIFRVNVVEVENLVEVIKNLQKHKIQVLATDLNTECSIYDVSYKKSAIVIGNEGNGVSKEILDISDKKIKIPMKGKAESLNVSVATGIILYTAIKNEM